MNEETPRNTVHVLSTVSCASGVASSSVLTSGMPHSPETNILFETQQVCASSSSTIGSSQPSHRLYIPDNTPLQLSSPTLTTMQAPLYNYGYQNLGQSMHYYPPCSPPPLIPSTSILPLSIGPRTAIRIQTPTPSVQQEPRPSISSPL